MVSDIEHKQNTYEELTGKMVLLQSELEGKINTLQSLINIAHTYAEYENSDLAYILGELKNKIKDIQKLAMSTDE